MALLRKLLKWLLPILVALYGMFYWNNIASRRYFEGDVDLKGKTVIVTGGNSGIGKVTALDLAQRGARVILACRNLHTAEEAAKEMKTRTGNSEVVVRQLDLASLQSVREFARKILESESRLDILINNAGVHGQWSKNVTKENFDLSFGVNHFGHFLLTNLLLDLLRKSAPSRVVTVSSVGHESVAKQLNFTRSDPTQASFLYPHLRTYRESKLANVLFARELARREARNGVTSTSLHPGTINTPIWKTTMTRNSAGALLYYALSPLFWLIFIDEEAGAQTILHCALDASVAKLSGSYFDNCREKKPSLFAQDDETARRLWDVSCQATGLKNCSS